LALLYFPIALHHLVPHRIPRALIALPVVALVLFQSYQGVFHSWIAVHGQSQRSAELAAGLGTLSKDASIFIYQAPETVIFLPARIPYYQYIQSTSALGVGAEQIPLIASGVPDFVLTGVGDVPRPDLSQYKEEKKMNRYTLWKRI
jgi:hypothetical protein